MAALDKETAALREECAVVMELIRKCVEENARAAQDQQAYQERFDGLIARYETAKRRLDAITGEKLARSANRECISRVLADLKQRDCLPTEFDEELWYMTVDSVTVHSEAWVTIIFKSGTEIDVDVRGK